MKKRHWFLISFIVILIDQGSKYGASSLLTPYQPVSVIPMLSLTLAYNSGAAFSFLSDAGAWHHYFFIGFSLIMSMVLSLWMVRLLPIERLQLLALSLILGGAIGNLIDRVLFGSVIDFIDLYYKHHHWPVFNIADSAICIGAFLLLIDLIHHQK